MLLFFVGWPLERVFFRAFKRKKKFVIFQYQRTIVGIFGILNEVLGGLAYAERRNLIPVIDMRTCKNVYLNDDEVGKINAWEYFFEQPAGISLDEALSSKNYVVENAIECLMRPAQGKYFFHNTFGEFTFWRNLFRKYIRFSPSVTDRLERMKAKYEGLRILGVRVRGTDYVTTKPRGHAIPPTPEQAIAKAREAMSEQHFDAVYLATEDKRIVAKFQEAFGDKLILPEAQYVDYDYTNHTTKENWIIHYGTDRPNDKYISGLEYIVSILFLSRCEGLITSGNGGAVVAVMFAEGFDYFYFFSLGTYSGL